MNRVCRARQPFESQAGADVVQRGPATRVALGEPLVRRQVAEQLLVLDERQRLVLLPRRRAMTRSLSWSTTWIGSPCSSTPSAYRAHDATTSADRSISPPFSRLVRMTGTSHFGMRSELSAQSRASVSRTSGFANRSMSWCL
jgi:hypothetical protein